MQTARKSAPKKAAAASKPQLPAKAPKAAKVAKTSAVASTLNSLGNSTESRVAISKLRHGLIAVVKISDELKIALQRVMDLRHIFHMSQSNRAKIVQILDKKETIEFQYSAHGIDGDCREKMSVLCRGILDELSSSDLTEGLESLSVLMEPTDDLSMLNLFRYQRNCSVDMHEDQGMSRPFMNRVVV
jgi:hypothetical protein